MNIEFLKDKKIVIYGYGKLQQDFEYIFNEITVSYYMTAIETQILFAASENVKSSFKEVKEIFVEDDFLLEKIRSDFTNNYTIIICEMNPNKAHKILVDLGFIYRQNFFLAEDFFDLLDYNLENQIKGRKIAFWGVGEEKKYVEKHTNLKCDFYLDKNAYKMENFVGGGVKSPSEIKNWSNIFVVVTTLNYYEEIRIELISYGLNENEDFIHYRKILPEMYSRMYKPSQMMKKTFYALPIKHEVCSKPFNYISIEEGGNVYCCCPSWVSTALGNIAVSSCHDVWNSAIARIFRLSIINKTFSFCNHDECDLSLKKIKNDYSGERYKDLKPVQIPDTLSLNIDGTCNLKCKQCRPDFYKIQGTNRILLKTIVRKIKDSGWLPDVNRLIVGGYGETFVSDVYQDIAFNDVKNQRNDIFILSNGILFNYSNWSKVKQAYKNISVSISVDAATEETYNKIRGGSWAILLKNLCMLKELRMKNEINFFKLTFVVQMDNFHEMADFVKLAQSFHVDAIVFQKIHKPGYMSESEFEKISVVYADKKPKKGLIEEIIRVDNINDHRINLYQLKPYIQ